ALGPGDVRQARVRGAVLDRHAAPLVGPDRLPVRRAGGHPLPVRRGVPVVLAPDPHPLAGRVLLLRGVHDEDAHPAAQERSRLGATVARWPRLHRTRGPVSDLVAVVLHDVRCEILRAPRSWKGNWSWTHRWRPTSRP